VIRWNRPAGRKPAALVTKRFAWTTDNLQARPASLAMEITLPGMTPLPEPGSRPAWVRFVVLVACSQAAPDADWPGIGAAFEAFLARPPAADLIADTTDAGREASWTRRPSSMPGIIEMVLGDNAAAARLELPSGTERLGRDDRQAMLIVHVEPRTRDGAPAGRASPPAWRRRFAQVLQLPGAFASLLSGELGLITSGEPPPQIGIGLQAPHNLAELLDIEGSPFGGVELSQFMGYVTADRTGASAAIVADWIILRVMREALTGIGPGFMGPGFNRQGQPDR
jgi:hypothetical protein